MERDRFVYARSKLFVLIPFTLLFGSGVAVSLVVVIRGVMRADGQAMVTGLISLFATLALFLPTVFFLRGAWRDANVPSAQRKR